MTTIQVAQHYRSDGDDGLLQEVERLRREVALLEQQHGGLEEDMGAEEGYFS